MESFFFFVILLTILPDKFVYVLSHAVFRLGENYVAVPGLNGPELNQFPFSNVSVLATNSD